MYKNVVNNIVHVKHFVQVLKVYSYEIHLPRHYVLPRFLP